MKRKERCVLHNRVFFVNFETYQDILSKKEQFTWHAGHGEIHFFPLVQKSPDTSFSFYVVDHVLWTFYVIWWLGNFNWAAKNSGIFQLYQFSIKQTIGGGEQDPETEFQ